MKIGPWDDLKPWKQYWANIMYGSGRKSQIYAGASMDPSLLYSQTNPYADSCEAPLQAGSISSSCYGIRIGSLRDCQLAPSQLRRISGARLT